MAEVAVTGANGHLGGLLVRELLERGDSVRALVYGPVPNLDGLDIEVMPIDTTKPATLQAAFDGVDVVYNLAGRISLVKGDEAQVRAINVDGTANVVAAVAASGARRLVHFSSIHAFEHEPAERVITEDVPLVTHGAPAYSQSKADGQRLVEAAVDRGEVDAVVIHPAGCIGPLDFGPSPMGRTIRDFARGSIPAIVTGGFSWVDGRDVARAAIAAGDRGQSGNRYLVAGHWRSVADTAAALAELGGVRAPTLVLPMVVAQAAAPISEAYARVTRQPARFTQASLHALRYHQRIDDGKARRELGHDPRPIEQTFADTVAWFADQGALD